MNQPGRNQEDKNYVPGQQGQNLHDKDKDKEKIKPEQRNVGQGQQGRVDLNNQGQGSIGQTGQTGQRDQQGQGRQNK